MTEKKYIFWDNDGVLVDTEQWFYEANKKAMSGIGFYFTLTEYLAAMEKGKSIWNMVYQSGFDKKAIKIQRQKRDQYYQDFLKSKDIEIPSVVDVLKELKKRYSMAIITTSKKKDFELIHRNRNILDYMDFYLTREDYHDAKPLPEPYLKGMYRFNAGPEECIVVEDSGRGLQAASASDMDCIIVKHAFVASHNFCKAKYIVDSIKDILNIL